MNKEAAAKLPLFTLLPAPSGLGKGKMQLAAAIPALNE